MTVFYNGLRVVLDPHMLEEDWSRVRSPGRARRRMRRGYRQNVTFSAMKTAYIVGKTLVMHPEMWHELKRHTKNSDQSSVARQATGRF